MHDAGARIEPPRHLDELAYAVIGAGIEVHRNLGPGFLEAFYEAALMVELADRCIAAEQQVAIPVLYKGKQIGESRLDLVVEGELVLEIKAIDRFAAVHTAQLISYLRAGAFQLGLLMNFNVAVFKHGVRRVIHSG